MNNINKKFRYVLGLDIGITSIGWAALALNEDDEPYKIIALNSRIFTAAENPKDGSSLAADRRIARGIRRRLRRRRHRLDRIIHLFSRHKIGTNEEIKNILDAPSATDIFSLRRQALDKLLSVEEWIKVLYHIAKYRGFKSNRKNESKASEEGKVLEAVKQNKELLDKYRTVGEMIACDEKFSDKKHNTTNSYIMTVGRDMLTDEINAIFDAQRKLGNEHSDEKLQEEYLNIFLSQRSFAEGPGEGSPYGGDQIEKMIGYCTFERQNGEKRAPKASYAFMKFSLLQKINHITLREGSKEQKLTDEERKIIEALAWEKSGVTFADIRKKLELPISVTFKEIFYRNAKDGEEPEVAIAEGEKKAKLAFTEPYHDIRKALDKAEKNRIKALSPAQLDDIAYAFTVFRTDDALQAYLSEKGIEEKDRRVLLENLNTFSKFGHLSLKACYKIIPFLEQGLTYDKACEAAGYDFRNQAGEKTVLLPTNNAEINEIPNPVVKRAVTQTIKLMNAIIREYGSPVEVHIELAREMGHTFDDRTKMRKSMEDNKARNEQIKKKLRETYGVLSPTGQDILTLRLLDEQNFCCAYSQKVLDAERVFKDGKYIQIDHIIPYSRSFDDSYNNKVVVLTAENQHKGNNIPLKYLGADPARRNAFIAWVEGTIRNRAKKHRLLLEEYTESMARDWKERSLTDTRYISKLVHGFLNEHLLLAEGKRTRRIIPLNGAVTSYIRKRLGINKIREAGDLHHAVDAAVIACATQGTVKTVTEYSKRMEIAFSKAKDGKIIDHETGEIINRENYADYIGAKFPEPWINFRKELEARVSNNPAELLGMLKLPTYTAEEIEALKPVYVSRMPRRSVKGPAHKDTLFSPRLKEQSRIIKKVPLSDIKLNAQGEIAGYYNPESDTLLYNALKERLLSFNNNPEKAFAEPFHKPKADGMPGPLVHKIKIVEKSTLNVSLNDGKSLAANESMVRVDVFYIPEGRDKGYYFVPLYVSDVVKDKLPNKAIVQGKDYENWKEMNDKDFCFSLYKNDLFFIERKKAFEMKNEAKFLPDKNFNTDFFYYEGINISSSNLNITNHDNAYKNEGIGLKTAIKLQKAVIDYLGNISLVQKEPRLPLRVNR